MNHINSMILNIKYQCICLRIDSSSHIWSSECTRSSSMSSTHEIKLKVSKYIWHLNFASKRHSRNCGAPLPQWRVHTRFTRYEGCSGGAQRLFTSLNSFTRFILWEIVKSWYWEKSCTTVPRSDSQSVMWWCPLSSANNYKCRIMDSSIVLLFDMMIESIVLHVKNAMTGM